MTRFTTEAEAQAYQDWHGAVLVHVDHRTLCQSGCSLSADVCPTGLTNAAAERETWRSYYDARPLEVTT